MNDLRFDKKTSFSRLNPQKFNQVLGKGSFCLCLDPIHSTGELTITVKTKNRNRIVHIVAFHKRMTEKR